MQFSKLVVLLTLSLVPVMSLAVDFDPAKNNTGLSSTEKTLTFLSEGRDPATISFALINAALTFLGVIAMLTILYAGVLWFRSGDNEETLSKAKDLIRGGLVGLFLTLGALSIGTLFFNYLVKASGQ